MANEAKEKKTFITKVLVKLKISSDDSTLRIKM